MQAAAAEPAAELSKASSETKLATIAEVSPTLRISSVAPRALTGARP